VLLHSFLTLAMLFLKKLQALVLSPAMHSLQLVPRDQQIVKVLLDSFLTLAMLFFKKLQALVHVASYA
jgi:hypothetical protein